jgi:hypothetical protein
MDKTVIYLTNNILDPTIETMCRHNILKSIGDCRLISVSQKPIDFGENIVTGILPFSSLSICLQTREALKVITTKYVAIAEHDCLYTPEHFEFIPPDENYWYNDNVWFLQTDDGLYSLIKDRKANSQLTCTTEAMKKSIDIRIEIMSDPAWLKRYPMGRVGEAGAMEVAHAQRLASAIPSHSKSREMLCNYVATFIGKNWCSKLPNIDLRHSNNFTKRRRGIHRKYELEPWGTLKDVLWNSQ